MQQIKDLLAGASRDESEAEKRQKDVDELGRQIGALAAQQEKLEDEATSLLRQSSRSKADAAALVYAELESGTKQADLADAIGVAQGTVSKLKEIGKAFPNGHKELTAGQLAAPFWTQLFDIAKAENDKKEQRDRRTTQQQIRALLGDGTALTQQEIVGVTGKSRAAVSEALRELAADGAVERDILSGRYSAPPQQDNGAAATTSTTTQTTTIDTIPAGTVDGRISALESALAAMLPAVRNGVLTVPSAQVASLIATMRELAMVMRAKSVISMLPEDEATAGARRSGSNQGALEQEQAARGASRLHLLDGRRHHLGRDREHPRCDHLWGERQADRDRLRRVGPLATRHGDEGEGRMSELRDQQAKKLETIRSLLRKAEDPSVTPAEAEAFSGKAAQMMATHGIEVAMLEAAEAVEGRQQQVDQTLISLADETYRIYKITLLDAAATACHCKVIFGGTTAHVFGYDSDRDLVSMLYTSLLLQASHALLAEELPYGDNIRSFTSAWWDGYSTRIEKRLMESLHTATQEAEQRSPGAELVVRQRAVLAERASAVERAIHEVYPSVGTMSAPCGGASSAGYAAGQRAGQNADLGSSRRGGSPRGLER